MCKLIMKIIVRCSPNSEILKKHRKSMVIWQQTISYNFPIYIPTYFFYINLRRHHRYYSCSEVVSSSVGCITMTKFLNSLKYHYTLDLTWFGANHISTGRNLASVILLIDHWIWRQKGCWLKNSRTPCGQLIWLWLYWAASRCKAVSRLQPKALLWSRYQTLFTSQRGVGLQWLCWGHMGKREVSCEWVE